jgi:hypothetical protein
MPVGLRTLLIEILGKATFIIVTLITMKLKIPIISITILAKY